MSVTKGLSSQWFRENSGTVTPWGRAQAVYRYGFGVSFYSTASHGGYKVCDSRNRNIPFELRSTDGWYEEDQEYLIPSFIFFDDFHHAAKSATEKELTDFGLSHYVNVEYKDELLKNLKAAYGAAYDVACNAQKSREVFEDEEDYLAYLRQSQTAKERAVQMENILRIKDGDLIEFKTPLTFKMGSYSLQVSKFQVVQERTKIRFRAMENGASFLAKIIGWKENQFSILTC